MKLTHYTLLPSIHTLDVQTLIDDFGNEVKMGDARSYDLQHRMFWNAFRFANGISYDETQFRSIGIMVEEH